MALGAFKNGPEETALMAPTLKTMGVIYHCEYKIRHIYLNVQNVDYCRCLTKEDQPDHAQRPR